MFARPPEGSCWHRSSEGQQEKFMPNAEVIKLAHAFTPNTQAKCGFEASMTLSQEQKAKH